MGKSFGFGGQIGFSIDETGFKRHMAEPGPNSVDIHTSA
jgi:hypothetical protein